MLAGFLVNVPPFVCPGWIFIVTYGNPIIEGLAVGRIAAFDRVLITDPNKTTYTDKVNTLPPIYMKPIIWGERVTPLPHIYHPNEIDALLEALRETLTEEQKVFLVMKLGDVIKDHLKGDGE